MTLETTHCPSCGAVVEDQDAFCGNCGRRLQHEPVPDPVPPVSGAGTAAGAPKPTRTAQYQPGDSPAANRAQVFDIAKLDLTARVTVVCGLLAFIDSFLPWYTVSFGGVGLSSVNAWNEDYAWVPMLLLLALGIATALPAFGLRTPVWLTPVTVTGVGLLCVIIVAVRWVTFPSGTDLGVSAGAGFGTYLGMALALVVTGFGIRADATQDRVLPRLLAAVKQRPPSGPTAPPRS